MFRGKFRISLMTAGIGMAVALAVSVANAEGPPKTTNAKQATPPAAPGRTAISAPGAATPAPAAPATPGEGPQIVFDTPTYEFGKMMAGDPIRHDFWFTNRGNKPLEITGVRPSCGCTTAGTFDHSVLPGKTGKIPIMVKTDRISGEVQKTVMVTTNVPGQQANITLWIKGTVWQPVELKPPLANIGSITDNKPHTQDIQIINHLPDPIDIKDVKCDNAVFRVEVKPVTKGKEYAMTVTVSPPFKTGPNHGTITMATGNAKSPVLTVTAMCYIPTPVEVSPNKVIMPAGALSQDMERAVYVSHNTAAPLKLSGVMVNNSQITSRMIEDIPGKRFRLVLKFPAGMTVPSNDQYRLTFKTDDATMPEVTVPIASMPTQSTVQAQQPAFHSPITITPKTAAGSPPPAPGSPPGMSPTKAPGK